MVQVEALEVLESARRCNVDVDDDRADGYVVDDESSLSTNNSMFPEDENLDSDWYIDCALFSPEDVGIAPIVPTVTPSSVFSSLPDLTPESSLSSEESGLLPDMQVIDFDPKSSEGTFGSLPLNSRLVFSSLQLGTCDYVSSLLPTLVKEGCCKFYNCTSLSQLGKSKGARQAPTRKNHRNEGGYNGNGRYEGAGGRKHNGGGKDKDNTNGDSGGGNNHGRGGNMGGNGGSGGNGGDRGGGRKRDIENGGSGGNGDDGSEDSEDREDKNGDRRRGNEEESEEEGGKTSDEEDEDEEPGEGDSARQKGCLYQSSTSLRQRPYRKERKKKSSHKRRGNNVQHRDRDELSASGESDSGNAKEGEVDVEGVGKDVEFPHTDAIDPSRAISDVWAMTDTDSVYGFAPTLCDVVQACADFALWEQRNYLDRTNTAKSSRVKLVYDPPTIAPKVRGYRAKAILPHDLPNLKLFVVKMEGVTCQVRIFYIAPRKLISVPYLSHDQMAVIMACLNIAKARSIEFLSDKVERSRLLQLQKMKQFHFKPDNVREELQPDDVNRDIESCTSQLTNESMKVFSHWYDETMKDIAGGVDPGGRVFEDVEYCKIHLKSGSRERMIQIAEELRNGCMYTLSVAGVKEQLLGTPQWSHVTAPQFKSNLIDITKAQGLTDVAKAMEDHWTDWQWFHLWRKREMKNHIGRIQDWFPKMKETKFVVYMDVGLHVGSTNTDNSVFTFKEDAKRCVESLCKRSRKKKGKRTNEREGALSQEAIQDMEGSNGDLDESMEETSANPEEDMPPVSAVLKSHRQCKASEYTYYGSTQIGGASSGNPHFVVKKVGEKYDLVHPSRYRIVGAQVYLPFVKEMRNAYDRSKWDMLQRCPLDTINVTRDPKSGFLFDYDGSCASLHQCALKLKLFNNLSQKMEMYGRGVCRNEIYICLGKTKKGDRFDIPEKYTTEFLSKCRVVADEDLKSFYLSVVETPLKVFKTLWLRYDAGTGYTNFTNWPKPVLAALCACAEILAKEFGNAIVPGPLMSQCRTLMNDLGSYAVPTRWRKPIDQCWRDKTGLEYGVDPSLYKTLEGSIEIGSARAEDIFALTRNRKTTLKLAIQGITGKAMDALRRNESVVLHYCQVVLALFHVFGHGGGK